MARRPYVAPFVKKGTKVLSYRATTGFGGLIVVTAILLLVQLVTGVGGLPL